MARYPQMLAQPEHKVCTRCKRDLPIESFVKTSPWVTKGRKAKCKRCQNALVTAWHQKQLPEHLRFENFYDPLHPRFMEFCGDDPVWPSDG